MLNSHGTVRKRKPLVNFSWLGIRQKNFQSAHTLLNMPRCTHVRIIPDKWAGCAGMHIWTWRSCSIVGAMHTAPNIVRPVLVSVQAPKHAYWTTVPTSTMHRCSLKNLTMLALYCIAVRSWNTPLFQIGLASAAALIRCQTCTPNALRYIQTCAPKELSVDWVLESGS